MTEQWESKCKTMLGSMFTFQHDVDQAPAPHPAAVDLCLDLIRVFKSMEQIARRDLDNPDNVTRTLLNLAVLFDANPLWADNKAFLQPILWASMESFLDGMTIMQGHVGTKKPTDEAGIRQFMARDRTWFGSISAYVQLVQAVAYVVGGYGLSRILGPQIREGLLPILFWDNVPDLKPTES